jgi:hypothetical protein
MKSVKEPSPNASAEPLLESLPGCVGREKGERCDGLGLMSDIPSRWVEG